MNPAIIENQQQRVLREQTQERAMQKFQDDELARSIAISHASLELNLKDDMLDTDGTRRIRKHNEREARLCYLSEGVREYVLDSTFGENNNSEQSLKDNKRDYISKGDREQMKEDIKEIYKTVSHDTYTLSPEHMVDTTFQPAVYENQYCYEGYHQKQSMGAVKARSSSLYDDKVAILVARATSAAAEPDQHITCFNQGMKDAMGAMQAKVQKRTESINDNQMLNVHRQCAVNSGFNLEKIANNKWANMICNTFSGKFGQIWEKQKSTLYAIIEKFASNKMIFTETEETPKCLHSHLGTIHKLWIGRIIKPSHLTWISHVSQIEPGCSIMEFLNILEGVCACCQERLISLPGESTNRKVILLPCGHFMHQECLLKSALAQGGNQAGMLKCVQCRHHANEGYHFKDYTRFMKKSFQQALFFPEDIILNQMEITSTRKTEKEMETAFMHADYVREANRRHQNDLAEQNLAASIRRAARNMHNAAAAAAAAVDVDVDVDDINGMNAEISIIDGFPEGTVNRRQGHRERVNRFMTPTEIRDRLNNYTDSVQERYDNFRAPITPRSHSRTISPTRNVQTTLEQSFRGSGAEPSRVPRMTARVVPAAPRSLRTLRMSVPGYQLEQEEEEENERPTRARNSTSNSSGRGRERGTVMETRRSRRVAAQREAENEDEEEEEA